MRDDRARARVRPWRGRLQQMMVLPRYTAFPSLLGQPLAPDLSRSRPSAAPLCHGAVVAQWQPVVLTTSLHQSSSSPPRYCRPAAGAPQRCFSAVVSLQVIIGVAGLAEKLPAGAVEPKARSCVCLRALSAFAGGSRRFQTRTGAGSVRALNLACLLRVSACRCCAERSTQLKS